MLIIEGSDLLGKTTLAQKLTKLLNEAGHAHQYSHFTRLPDAHDRCHDYIARISSKLVQDRFHMSEVAYCHGRGESTCRLTPERIRYVDGVLRTAGAFTVVLTASTEVIHKRFETRGDDMYKFDVIERANGAFLDIVDNRIFDFDVHLHFEKADDYPTEDQTKAILAKYLHRQEAIREILEGPTRR